MCSGPSSPYEEFSTSCSNEGESRGSASNAACSGGKRHGRENRLIDCWFGEWNDR